ncbi:Fur family transcriptional regulator [Campylobacter showae]|jgi:transcriptional regulator, fur family|uniref:Ferric uptake regulation protein n=1 Tax=Campylobacter showae CSUNSWCD TaxID=1244083 RepID=M5INA2_9BACT|nr:transcriptional repressor [Campylobacter showae]EKU10164.1 Ferric uptake regulation protein FUR [Campylobacter showae CSUNSWCD]
MHTFDKFYMKFLELLRDYGYKNSAAKEQILKILFSSDEHLGASEIQTKIKSEFRRNVSLTAIYQFLNFLQDFGLVLSFEENGINKFELNLKSHHDHLVCTKCGATENFFDKDIEEKQEQICRNSGFKLEGHAMILYGICLKCQNK